MAVLDLQLIGGLVVNDMQKVNSAYEKTSKPVNFVSKSEVLHIDKKKKSHRASSFHRLPNAYGPSAQWLYREYIMFGGQSQYNMMTTAM